MILFLKAYFASQSIKRRGIPNHEKGMKKYCIEIMNSCYLKALKRSLPDFIDSQMKEGQDIFL